MNTRSSQDCPCCGTVAELFFDGGQLPVNSTTLMRSRPAALAEPRGRLRLCVCPGCGFIFNSAFDPARIRMDADLEETQGFSPTFVRFHEALAADLVRRHRLWGRRIVEIGCGKGEFLALLARMAGGSGHGFDPAFVPGRAGPGQDRIRVEPILFGSAEADRVRGDLFVCKMTLEHIQYPPDFLDLIGRAARASGNAPLVLMVPETLVILDRLQVWDLYYEHCSNFTPGSLARLFRAHGLAPTVLRTAFDGHYLIIEATPGAAGAIAALDLPEEEPQQVVDAARRFGDAARLRLDGWRDRMERWGQAGRKVVLWGSGSRATALANMVGLDDRVQAVVDINPHRRGSYVAGTGHPVVGPADLAEIRPDVVVVMNPVYRDEIAALLRQQGLSPVLEAV